MVVRRSSGYLGSGQLLLKLRDFLDVFLEESLHMQRPANYVNKEDGTGCTYIQVQAIRQQRNEKIKGVP